MVQRKAEKDLFICVSVFSFLNLGKQVYNIFSYVLPIIYIDYFQYFVLKDYFYYFIYLHHRPHYLERMSAHCRILTTLNHTIQLYQMQLFSLVCLNADTLISSSHDFHVFIPFLLYEQQYYTPDLIMSSLRRRCKQNRYLSTHYLLFVIQ